MKRYGILGAALCLAAGVTGCSGEDAASLTANPFPPLPPANTTYFDVTDEAGHWFDTREKIAGTNSLAVVKPNRKIKFLQTRSFNGPSRVESLHTVTSLIWPAGAEADERLDQATANKDDHEVTLRTPGLHVFVCKVHPYMLAGVIVDRPDTTVPGTTPPQAALDIGDKIHLLGVTHTASVKDAADDTKALPSASDIGKRLLRAFFVVTSPANWKDYTNA